MKEEWRAVSGYKGLYEVSNCGRVRSLPREVNTKGGKKRFAPGYILKPFESKWGYYLVGLSIGQKKTTCSIHRIVASAFIPNPDNLPCVNHKDENRKNNHVNNLEWCTYSYNALYGKAIEKKRNAGCFREKKVEQLDYDGNVLNEYVSLHDAGRKSGVDYRCIWEVCKGKRPTAGGYKWRYKT